MKKKSIVFNQVFCLLVLIVLFINCTSQDNSENDNSQYKNDMRAFVIGISHYSKAINPNFAIIPQNGIELVSTNGDENGAPNI